MKSLSHRNLSKALSQIMEISEIGLVSETNVNDRIEMKIESYGDFQKYYC